MSKETKAKRIISPLKLPKSVRDKLPEAQKDYEKAFVRMVLLISIIILIVFVIVIIACL